MGCYHGTVKCSYSELACFQHWVLIVALLKTFVNYSWSVSGGSIHWPHRTAIVFNLAAHTWFLFPYTAWLDCVLRLRFRCYYFFFLRTCITNLGGALLVVLSVRLHIFYQYLILCIAAGREETMEQHQFCMCAWWFYFGRFSNLQQ